MSFQQQSPSTSGKFKEGTRGLTRAAGNIANSQQAQDLKKGFKSAGNSVLSALGLKNKENHMGQPGMGEGMGGLRRTQSAPDMRMGMGGKRRRKSRKRKSRRSKKRRTKRRRKSRRSKSRRRRRR